MFFVSPKNLLNSCMLDENPTSANLENDHGFIIKEYYLHCPTSANLENDHGFIIKEYYLHYPTSANLENDHGFIFTDMRRFGEV